jgi:hypothetical protein
MKSTEIQQVISKLETQVSAKKLELESIIEEFRRELPAHAESWMKRRVESAIETHAAKVEALGLERVQALKAEVSQLFSRLPQIVRAETADPRDWPHNRPADTSGYGEGRNEPFFDKAFRGVISHVATVLHRYGLLESPKGYAEEWNRIGEGRFRYGLNPGFQDMHLASVSRHQAVFSEWERMNKELATAKADLSKAKARELWDSA